MKKDDSKDISYLKGFLTLNKEEVMELHYGKGLSVSQICIELGNKYSKELVCPPELFLRTKSTIPEHLLNILGYPDWETYAKRLPRLKSRARYKHGFTPKLRKEVFKKCDYSCNNCGESEKLEVFHKDGNPLNSDMDNLTLLCVDCRQAIVFGRVSSDQARTLRRISNFLVDYSNWLESKGIAIKDVINDEKKRQILGQAFIREVKKSLRLTKEEKELIKKYEKFLE